MTAEEFLENVLVEQSVETDSDEHADPRESRVADGVANRMDRLRCLGNGQVPAVAARAWELLTR